MTAYEQRSYPGAAADTVLAADITLGATTFSVTAGTGAGYPDGSGGPFFVIIDYDNSKAEKIRCSGRVNDVFTVAGTGGGRGQDGTTAQAHTAPAKVRACITATDVQEANRAAANTIGLVTTKGDLLTGSGANTLARTAAGANGTLPIFDSTQAGGIRAGANPALVSPTITTATFTGAQTFPNGSIDTNGFPLLRKPFMAASNASGFAVANGTWVTVGLTSLGGYSITIGTPTTRMVAAAPAWYRVSASFASALQGDGPWEVMVRKNAAGAPGTGTLVLLADAAAAASSQASASPSTLVQLAATDYIELFVTQNSGGGLNVLANNIGAMLCADYVSAL